MLLKSLYIENYGPFIQSKRLRFEIDKGNLNFLISDESAKRLDIINAIRSGICSAPMQTSHESFAFDNVPHNQVSISKPTSLEVEFSITKLEKKSSYCKLTFYPVQSSLHNIVEVTKQKLDKEVSGCSSKNLSDILCRLQIIKTEEEFEEFYAEFPKHINSLPLKDSLLIIDIPDASLRTTELTTLLTLLSKSYYQIVFGLSRKNLLDCLACNSFPLLQTGSLYTLESISKSKAIIHDVFASMLQWYTLREAQAS